jgi:hypothetical protein
MLEMVLVAYSFVVSPPKPTLVTLAPASDVPPYVVP